MLRSILLRVRHSSLCSQFSCWHATPVQSSMWKLSVRCFIKLWEVLVWDLGMQICMVVLRGTVMSSYHHRLILVWSVIISGGSGGLAMNMEASIIQTHFLKLSWTSDHLVLNSIRSCQLVSSSSDIAFLQKIAHYLLSYLEILHFTDAPQPTTMTTQLHPWGTIAFACQWHALSMSMCRRSKNIKQIDSAVRSIKTNM